MSKCQTCPYSFGGNYDPLSDWCDECTHDPDTGWGGFTDHRVGQHLTMRPNDKPITIRCIVMKKK